MKSATLLLAKEKWRSLTPQQLDSVIDYLPLLVIRDGDLNIHVIVIGRATVLALEYIEGETLSPNEVL
jgi:hypothetical protein